MLRTILLAVLLFGCATAPARDARNARAEIAMQALAAHGFVGSALVACGARTLFAGDYGLNAGRRKPSYWLASLSKPITAIAVLQLAEAGKLRLDDPLSRFLPRAPAEKGAITLAQLLVHTSGLPQNYAADGIADRDTAALAIFDSPLTPSPQPLFRYSNNNYTLLAMAVEIASGERFEDYLRMHVLVPAGMREAGFWPETGDDLVPPLIDPPKDAAASANWGFRGGFGMRASVQDLHRLALALDRGALLPATRVAELYAAHTLAGDGDGVGYGWFTSVGEDGRRWLWARGSDTSGSNAVLYRLEGSPLMIVAATDAGPAEDAGPGWSRQARDALMAIYDADACS